MNSICVLAREGDLYSFMLIKELQITSVHFDICWISIPKRKEKFKRGRFKGMSIWSFVFWKDYIKQFAFGFSKTQQEILKNYFPIDKIQNQNDNNHFLFNDLEKCKDYLYDHGYQYVIVGGVPILPQFFFERDNIVFIGCHPAPLPLVKGEDHLVFTLLYDLQPSVSVYRLNRFIDGGDIYLVKPLEDITYTDSFYSIMLKLEVFRAKTLARFVLDLSNGNNLQVSIRNIGRLHQYKNVTNDIRQKAEDNLQKLLLRQK